MKYLGIAICVFISSLTGADERSSNRQCIMAIEKYNILPEGRELVALKGGGILLVSPGTDDSIFVTNGRIDPSINDMYRSYSITKTGNCNMSRSSENGTGYLRMGLSEFMKNPTNESISKAKDLISACQNAPAFLNTIKEVTKTFRAEAPHGGVRVDN